MEKTELDKIIEKHMKWLNGIDGGERANLSRVDLSGANLSRVDLSWANLYGANLSRVDLSWANLYGANLSMVDLSGANLSRVDLSWANLYGANLSMVDLYGAKNADIAMAITIVPSEGDIIGWKKAKSPNGKSDVIVKLRIPVNAARSSATTRKCRAEYAEVLEVIGADYAVSSHDYKTEYRVGATVRPDSWDNNRWNECSNGIHFFITRAEAEAW